MPLGESFHDVLDAARLGSEWAWSALWEDLAGSVVGYMRARGVSEPDEAVGDVFASMASSLGGFTGDEDAFRSWVFTIAHRRMVDHTRRRSRSREEPTAEPSESEVVGGDPADVFEMQASEDRALAMLASLTPDQAEVLALRVIGDLSLEQTAAVTGRKINAVKQLQHRAIKSLRRKISDEAVTR